MDHIKSHRCREEALPEVYCRLVIPRPFPSLVRRSEALDYHPVSLARIRVLRVCGAADRFSKCNFLQKRRLRCDFGNFQEPGQ